LRGFAHAKRYYAPATPSGCNFLAQPVQLRLIILRETIRTATMVACANASNHERFGYFSMNKFKNPVTSSQSPLRASSRSPA
jgi:hypothetical protein